MASAGYSLHKDLKDAVDQGLKQRQVNIIAAAAATPSECALRHLCSGSDAQRVRLRQAGMAVSLAKVVEHGFTVRGLAHSPPLLPLLACCLLASAAAPPRCSHPPSAPAPFLHMADCRRAQTVEASPERLRVSLVSADPDGKVTAPANL